MTAIKNALPSAGIITVDFNAWRFQNEPVLLIPLLDTIRASILAQAPRADDESQVTEVAHRLGKGITADDPAKPQSLYVAAFEELDDSFTSWNP